MRVIFHWPISLQRQIRDCRIDDCNLPILTANALKRHGYFFLRDVPTDGKRYISGFGNKGQQEVDAEKKRLRITKTEG